MSDKPRRMLLAKGHCSTCQSPVSVEVEEPEPIVKVETASCKCGMTENARGARWLALGAICLFICLAGSCITNQYFTTQQIKAVSEQYRVRKATIDDKNWVNQSDYVVEPKPAPEPKK